MKSRAESRKQFDEMKSTLGLNDSQRDPSRISLYTLANYLRDKRIDYTTGLNILQSNGVISDLVEDVLDVYGPDQLRAVEWMKDNVWRDKYGRIKTTTSL